jgi:hypothetical protein
VYNIIQVSRKGFQTKITKKGIYLNNQRKTTILINTIEILKYGI